MRLVCTTPNAISPINGHDFDPHTTGGLVSVKEIPADEAEVLLTVPGWYKLGEEPGGATISPQGLDLETLRAQAAGLGIDVKPVWKSARIQAEIDAVLAKSKGNDSAPSGEQ